MSERDLESNEASTVNSKLLKRFESSGGLQGGGNGGRALAAAKKLNSLKGTGFSP
jgi:hypothetical protein